MVIASERDRKNLLFEGEQEQPQFATLLKLMRLAKDIFSPAEFWVGSQFTACVSHNGCQDFLERSGNSKVVDLPLYERRPLL